jgi:hypothetical protein
MPDAFTVLTPAAFGAAILVGLLLGSLYLAEVQQQATGDPIVLLFAGVSFFVLVAGARFVDGATTWERNVGTGGLWCVFCGAAWVGLRLRWRLRR